MFERFVKEQTIDIIKLTSTTRQDRTIITNKLLQNNIVIVDITAVTASTSRDTLLAYLEGAMVNRGQLYKLDANIILLAPSNVEVIQEDQKEKQQKDQDD